MNHLDPPRFSNRAQHAIRAARERASLHGRPEADTADLLASILMPSSFASGILMKLADWGIVTHELEQLAIAPRMDGTNSLNAFLANLPDEPTTIGTEDLLELIVAAAHGDWARQLAAWGVDEVKIRNRRREMQEAQQAKGPPCERCGVPSSVHICTVNPDQHGAMQTSSQHFCELCARQLTLWRQA